MRIIHRPLLAALAASLLAPVAAAQDAGDKVLFVAPPDGHRPVVEAVAAATATVDMVMYHLTDPAVVNALAAARRRGVRVRVLLDGSSLKSSRFSAVAARLKAAGAEVRGSSPAFSITHEKALQIDGRRTLIMSMNMTGGAARTRDYGVATIDPGVAAEWKSVFEADWGNAQSGGDATPDLSRKDLLWSPVNSRARLVALASVAQKDLAATVENLGDPEIMAALGAAARRGVRVRVIAPMCDMNKDPLWNYPFLKKLSAAGVAARVMPAPSSPSHPYMHAKMMLVDGTFIYIGSVNYSTNSTTRARELGLLFSEPGPARRVSETFEKDWAAAVDVPVKPPEDCPALPD